MTSRIDLKVIVSFLISILVVAIQAYNDVYAGGVSGLEWLGIAAILFGPAGLVAAVANTPLSPATKALAQQISATVVVLVQALAGVYADGISDQEWMGVALLLLSSLAVYVAPGTRVARRA